VKPVTEKGNYLKLKAVDINRQTLYHVAHRKAMPVNNDGLQRVEDYFNSTTGRAILLLIGQFKAQETITNVLHSRQAVLPGIRCLHDMSETVFLFHLLMAVLDAPLSTEGHVILPRPALSTLLRDPQIPRIRVHDLPAPVNFLKMEQLN
jgi:hypothetical protein